MKRILYMTYDGLTDPLGQSQILPYVKGLAQAGYSFTILSFEKKDRYAKEAQTIRDIIKGSNIDWVPLSFTSKPPLLSKFYDALRMKRMATRLHKKYRFDMSHCRSYISADVGLYLKKQFGVKFFFDMRGFWADEKKDGGSWNTANPIFREVYKYYKKREAEYLQNADQIISLTEAGRNEMQKWAAYNPAVPLSVIPCCADMNVFSLTDDRQKMEGRKLLQISKESFTLSYLGSVGTWYMLDEMLELFKRIRQVYPQAVFLFVTHSDPRIILSRAMKYDIAESALKIVEARRHEVPLFIKASDINVSFIQPVYSKLSSSPTKLGEVLSMGIPVISNSGVGDVERIINETGAGFIFHQFSDAEYSAAVNSIPQLLAKKAGEIREKAELIYSLQRGVEKYIQAYHTVFSPDEMQVKQHLEDRITSHT